MMSQSIRSDPADRIAAECLSVRVRLLNRAITKLYDDALRPLGIKSSQLNILVAAALRELSSPGVICNRLKLDLSTLSRNVDRMAARGWIELVPDANDGRAHALRVTAKGRRLIERAEPAWTTVQGQVVDMIGATNAKALTRAAEAVRK
jgi:DNA-binding MarR family transcriptional regulator